MHQRKATIRRRRFNSSAGLAWVACVFGLLVLAISGSTQTVPTIEANQQSGIRRTNLLRNDLSVAGREILQVRVDFDPGAVFPKHHHPGEEIVFMIEGLLEYEVEGKPPVTLKAGDVLFIPAGAAHSVKNVGRGNGSELATYIVEKGKPLIALVK
jgi:quercetin dioxygenase-like cupin family protein